MFPAEGWTTWGCPVSPEVQIAAIRIDVQESEYGVFDGARRLLAAHRPVVFCEPGNNENRRRTLALFRELDYTLLVADAGCLSRFHPAHHRSQRNFILHPSPLPAAYERQS